MDKADASGVFDGKPAPVLKLDNIEKAFELKSGFFSRSKGALKAVDGVSLQVRQGDIYGLVGESGCGKTTLGYIAGGLVDPTQGSICLNGHDIGQCRVNFTAEDIQFIFQDISGSLNPKWMIREIIAEPLANLGTPKRRRQEMTMNFMVHVGLSAEYLDAYPHELSGGQRQRVCIARAMITHPKLIICDEPFSALDVSVQTQIINLLLKLKKAFGLTYLIISHDLALLEYMCNCIAVMYLGKIMEEASPARHLFSKPLHPYSQGLLNSFLFPDPNQLRIENIEILIGEVPNPVTPPRGCRFHPRCKHRLKICSHQEPLMGEVEPGRRVACHLFSA